jgi:hypothetical protein
MTQHIDMIEDMIKVLHPPQTTRPIRLLKESVKEEALARIGYFVTTRRRGKEVDRWAVLNWFVQIANEDFATMSPLRLKQKLAEYLALELGAVFDFESGVFNNDPISSDNLLQLQATVKQYLDQLMSKGSLEAGPFSVTIFLSFPSNIPGTENAKQQESRLYDGVRHYGEHRLMSGDEALIYVMSRCLGQFGDRLRKCPNCAKLFLQKRKVRSKNREGTYCSNSCRTLYGRKRKKAGNAAQTKLKDKKRHTHDSKTRRRASHGKKRR